MESVNPFRGRDMNVCLRYLSRFRLLTLLSLTSVLASQQSSSPFYDFQAEKPGTVHQVSVNDLPQPAPSTSAVNPPDVVERPAGAMPKTLPGFTVNLYADGLDVPRELRAAPNGDVFLAESDKGEIKVFRGVNKDGKPDLVSTFATGLNQPFGIAFYPVGPDPHWVYVGETGSVKKFPYKNDDLKASGPAQTVVAEIFPGAQSGHGHTTRDVVFSPDGKKMYVSVGSRSNIDD